VNPPEYQVNRRALLRMRRQSRPTEPRFDGEALADDGAGLVRVHRPAMGSFFEVKLAASTPGGVDLACRALDLIDSLETQLTVYRDDSEVSRLNARAHLGFTTVEPHLFRLLQTAVELSRRTQSAYDITSGALSEAWGFVRGPKRVPEPAVLADARARTGWRHLQFAEHESAIRFDIPGVRINLGSIGKGYAIDRAVEVIRNYWWPTSAIVHGGQSSLYAIGSPPGRFGGRWEVSLRNPANPEVPLGVIRLRNRALGTSGAAFQQFVDDGRVYGHIIDPRTGEPAPGPASVTVLAPTAAVADALSTAFYLMSRDAIQKYVAEEPRIGVILVERETSSRSQQVTTFNVTEEDFARDTDSVI
jgi:FAD:protein FMN transferase